MRKIIPLALLLPILLLSLCSCADGSSGETSFVLEEPRQEAQTQETAESMISSAAGDPAGHPADAAAVPDSGQSLPAAVQKDPDIVVHVCGAVISPGVYTLAAGSRICQAVEAAGGFAEDADDAYVNQAEVLTDGVRLWIPTREETKAPSGDSVAQMSPLPAVVTGPEASANGDKAARGLVNINTADAEALCTLTGVGPSTAAKIISYREANGAFSRIEDIMLVSGIKEKLFAKIRDSITV